ncbi:MAG: multidrug efflux RND transporter permease subunit [Chloroflexi bacterium]|nr:multidrug efflux RND transporter permease subunit [Chloroflexota bacterium]
MAKFFIHRPVLAIVIALIILIAGSLSMAALPISLFPDITPPTIQVQANYPGADAETVEQSIAIPLEEQINGTENMIYMSSTSTSDGRYNLTCTFAVGTDPDMDNVNVNNNVNKAMAKLPSDVVDQGVVVTKQSPNILMVVSVYSPDKTYDEVFLSNYASINLVDRISSTEGVGNTMIVGQRDYSMRLWVNPNKLTQLGLTAGDIANVVQEQNILAPAGSVGQPPAKQGTEFQYAINAKGRLDTLKEFGDMIVRAQPDGSFLRMKDVAKLELGAQTYYSYGRLDDVPATLVLVYQQPGANAISTAERLRKLLEQLGKDMPPGLTYEVTLDTTDFVKDSIKEVKNTLMDAVILVLMVVLLFLGSFRATLIPMLAVPVSLVGTFAGFAVFGFSINTLTLFGIVLAVGIVVDDAIVVVEAVESYIEKGFSPTEATERAMDDVSGPVVAIALVLCSVFIPVAFMGGITGQLYRQFALTLSISVLLSALTALTLTPALCRLILRRRKESNSIIDRFFGGFNNIFAKATASYTRTVRMILRKSFIFILLLLAFWGAAAGLLKTLPSGFLPDEDQGYIYAALTLPDGSSMQRTEELTAKTIDFAKKLPGVERVMTLGGLNILNSTFNSNTATLILELKPWDERKTRGTSLRSILTQLKNKINTYPEAVGIVTIPPPIPGLGSAGGFTFELQDKGNHTPEELNDTTVKFLQEASKRPELRNLFTGFRTTVPQINLEIDRDKAKNMGIPINSIFQSLQIYLGGYPVNDFNLFDRTYKVMIQAEAPYRQGPASIGNIHVRSNATGDMIPLSTITSVKKGPGPTLIQRYNLFRTAEISGMSAPGYSSGQAIKALEEIAAKVLPQGYGYQWSGTSYQEQLAGSAQSLIFVLALVFVFLFLAAQYESWAIPFSVLFGLPLGVFGALLLTYLFKNDNNTYTQIGIIMLLGLAAKNAILIVQFAKDRYEKEGMSLVDAAVDGAKVRLRPILMTSFAFILGVMPLVIASGAGAASRHALGTAVFGGMIAATSLGIFFIPLLYVLVEDFVNIFSKKKPADPAVQETGNETNAKAQDQEITDKRKDVQND